MSIGEIKHEGDLKRWMQRQLQTPGLIPQTPQTGVALIKEGVPTDEDFAGPPADGTLAYDTAAGVLHLRVDGSWVEL